MILALIVLAVGIFPPTYAEKFRQLTKKKKPNVLVILADDLGIGDTSVEPFTGTGILTPHLEKMARRGTIMSNFHAGAAICSPSRAAILTGMYPWRFGLAGVYDYGIPQKSNRNDWLPQVPTTAMAFHDAGYYTAHLGKWHLGGMRNYDLDMRRNSPYKKCPHPGPNQMGFDEYVTMEEGPDSPRQTFLQTTSTLHSQGGKYMYRNDVMEGGGCPGDLRILSDCEANHAIRVMEAAVARQQPFFIQLWFYAPHGPWESIPKYRKMYPKLRGSRPCESWANAAPERNCRLEDYMTMVTAMDNSAGSVLDALGRLGIENDTLVVFTSDNGPEDESGTTAGFKGRKRHLQEGGIRVPTIWQWPGVIPAGMVLKTFGMHTDLFPTFLDATGVSLPPRAMLDGVSLLPSLRGDGVKRRAAMSLVTSETTPKAMYFQKGYARFSDRVAMWYKDYEGPRATAGWMLDFKIHLNEKNVPVSFFDMLVDPFEDRNLIRSLGVSCDNATRYSIKSFGDTSLRSDSCLQKTIFTSLVPVLQEFAMYGADAHKIYLTQNPGRIMVLSGGREKLVILNKAKLCQGEGSCVCALPIGKEVNTLPFQDLPIAVLHVHPKPKNVTNLLPLNLRSNTKVMTQPTRSNLIS